MASIIPGCEYDIFISYRQKDNKGDRWVSEFVEVLKAELESTFKEEISVYFDINLHDGLLENHDVEASLKEKLKCAVFIPVISNTYCDPNSYAWEHEFRAFVELASRDSYGLKIKLPGGNVANRVLPVRIHDLDASDIKLCESVLGGTLRGVEFIYKSPGVNRPLRAKEENPHDNLNHTIYRDQINKGAHAIKEIIQGLKAEPKIPVEEKTQNLLPGVEISYSQKKQKKNRIYKIPGRKIIFMAAILLISVAGILSYPKIFKRNKAAKLTSGEIFDKAILYYDYFHVWSNYYGKMIIRSIQNEGIHHYDEIIEIITNEGFWQRTVLSDDQQTIYRIQNGKCFKEIISNNDPVKDTINRPIQDKNEIRDIKRMKGIHYGHFGLLMELKTSGLTLENKVETVRFQGVECLTLTFSCDSSKLKNEYFNGGSWKVYIDPVDYSMKGYETGIAWWGKGTYVVCTGILDVNGLKVPLCKTYFKGTDNSFWMVDVFAAAQ